MYIAKTLARFLISFACLFAFSYNAVSRDLIIPAEKLPLPLSGEQIEWLNEHPEIQLGAMDDWPPINFINQKGQADGFGVAFIDLLNQRLGNRLKQVSGDWPDIYQGVIDKKLDAVLDITPKASREPFFNFTKPYLTIPHVIIGRDEPPYYQNEKALTGKTIALEKGFGNVTFYRENYPEINITEYAGTSEALGAVAMGEADAYIGNRAVANNIIYNELISTLKVHSRAGKSGSVLSIGVRKDWPELTRILQVALDSVSSQEFHAILGDVIEKRMVTDTVRLTPAEKKWLDEHPTIRFSSTPDWPPLEYFNDDGQHEGIAADFLDLVAKKLNIELVLVNTSSWNRVLDGIRERKIDLIPMAMPTPYRKQFAEFTVPYVTNSMGIVTNNSVNFVPGTEGLAGKKVAVIDGYASHEMLSSEQPAMELLPYKNAVSALKAVSQGEAFAFVGNIATSSYIIQEQGLTNLRISGDTDYKYELAMAVRSDWPELKRILDKALATISSQEKAEIYSRWIRVEVSSGIPQEWILGASSILVALLIVVILFSVWNYQLNRKVKERTELLEYRSQHDELTQISNRASLVTQLEQKIAGSQHSQRSHFSVLFIDLDDFKKVNDTLGHAVGDSLLISVASRLKSVIRKTDFISRFGGDEFVIITDRVGSQDDIEAFCSHLLKATKEPYHLDGLTHRTTMSIGVSCYPEDGDTPDELLRKADTAMYVSKRQGRNHFNFFSETMNEHMTRRLLLEEELALSLERREISLAFQPIVQLDTGAVRKFEVLARWNNQKHGVIPPDEFISLAEHNGFINPLGEFILKNAIESCAWLSKKFDEAFSVTVNVSPVQLNQSDFIPLVLDMLERYQLPPNRLVLEITEGVLMNRSEQSEKALQELAEKGVLLAMDDFGTGYSSLSYVRNYPFNILKVDKEFIQDIPEDNKDLELVEAVLAMASSMNIDVIAEGVESEQQAEMLRTIGCKKAQGYYFSRPLAEPDLIEWLSKESRELH
ncbi:EAL domain-containing protein [Vibrio sp. JC009]|uniref:EAL domain-containing protein n=1 Tax=Vibrio sp. JC009 TaxID=2912314 RepID=UPI0023AF07CA|nr:transporter substrate-binding domain-containing protein [Vibrio sp. JC009]WED20940.1 EAL domain-containing protein [Vibrio sp. JC009]